MYPFVEDADKVGIGQPDLGADIIKGEFVEDMALHDPDRFLQMDAFNGGVVADLSRLSKAK